MNDGGYGGGWGENNPYHQQQQYYQEEGGGGYDGDGGYNQEYYAEGQEYYGEGQYDEYGDGDGEYYGGEYSENYDASHATEGTAEGDDRGVTGGSSLFLSLHRRHPFVAHPNGQRDSYGNYDTTGDPISAIAVENEGEGGGGSAARDDDYGASPSLMYVASHTSRQVDHRGRHGGLRGPASGGSRVGGVGGGAASLSGGKDPSLSRGSRLTVLYDDYPGDDGSGEGHQGVGGYYGNRSAYSTFVAHPEAPARTLDALHSLLFGGGDASFDYSVGGRNPNNAAAVPKARPSHAYGPPFGPATYTRGRSSNPGSNAHDVVYGPDVGGSGDRLEDRHCMGITRILPIGNTRHLGSGGRVCTISPDSVRVHTRGGMTMSSKGGILGGMVCGELMGGAANHLVTVGGMSAAGRSSAGGSGTGGTGQHVHCVDLSRDLRVVSSHTLVRSSRAGGGAATSSGGGGNNKAMCVADMASNVERNSIVVGCSDGTVRVLDGGRRNAEVAKAQAQSGGVARVAARENLIVATGYASSGHSSASSPLPYPFPAPHVLIYDVRYLGRGGVPHVFSSTFHQRGGPRFVDFLPDGRLLMGSGQTFGHFEVITPFSEAAESVDSSAYFQPELNAGEAMTTVNVGDSLYVGTSHGRVLQYGLNIAKTTHLSWGGSAGDGSIGIGDLQHQHRSASGGSTSQGTIAPTDEGPLDMPPFVPAPPAMSIDPAILLASKNSSVSVFNSYALSCPPVVSTDKALFHPRYSRSTVKGAALGPLAKKMMPPSKRWLNKTLQNKIDEISARPARGVDFVKVFPTASLELDELLSPDDPAVDETKRVESYPNPNKLLYSTSSFGRCYDATADPRKNLKGVIKTSRSSDQLGGEEAFISAEESATPVRYRLMIRPPFYKVSNFDYAAYNTTGLWVGWDYAPTFANSFACSVLAMLYFVDEVRDLALELQLSESTSTRTALPHQRESNVSVIAQLGLLFNHIESLSEVGMVQPSSPGANANRGQVKSFVPSNFISAFALLPEATNLCLLDGSAGQAEMARRPEFFYRFMMQHIERTSQGQVIDKLQGIGFLTVIEFAKGAPKISLSRSLTIDLAYDQRLIKRNSSSFVRFGEILRFSLCKDAPLRAWCDETRSYETVVQRKIATGLPPLLSLSCCCAGNTNPDGLKIWQPENGRNWLPEFIEVQIEADKSITVKELAVNENGEEEWMTHVSPMPADFFRELESKLPQVPPIKRRYRLEAVVSFIANTHADNSTDNDGSHSCEGHHVVHVRVPTNLKRKALTKQLHQIERCIVEKHDQTHHTLVSEILLDERCEQVQERLKAATEEWVLLNGFVVNKVDADDVRSFNGKEPSIVLFREIPQPEKEQSEVTQQKSTVPLTALGTTSISNGDGPKLTDMTNLPGKGDLVAIDAEFVCVQSEESHITSSGSKEITSEARNALGRLSIINCQTNEVIIDDYILPREPVVDYLTRFSGLTSNDLDSRNSPHHLITAHEAYLKVRLLMERGCIFLGHGLSQDFRVINICVPPHQIVDTAEIYHQPNSRYISLRYLTNYVFETDMQQEVHDSIEDARAAHDLYIKAQEMKREGKFQDYLMNLYAHGNKTQFKLGVANAN